MSSPISIPLTPSLSPTAGVTLVLLAVVFIYQLSAWIYNIYFHHLSSVPGPKLWAMSRIPRELSLVRGRLHKDVRALHEQYGDTVRIAPNGLSFIHPDAWTDIMVRRPGQAIPQRDLQRFSDSLRVNGAAELLTADDATHSRHRRMLAHAFSDRALKTQHQPLIQADVDVLMRQLRQRVWDPQARGKVDVANWLNLATFDIIGDLAFGEVFGCLEKGDYHPWVKVIFESVRAVTFLGCVKQFPWIDWALQLLISRWMLAVIRDHHALTIEKVSRRLAKESDRGDFLSQIMKHNGTEREMSRDEIMSNCNLLIPAGSETSAAAMMSLIYHVLDAPGVYRKLVAEIRDAFNVEKDITFEATENLPYLGACINESMRLYPPVPISNPRVGAPQGSMVQGIFVPHDVSLGIHHWATYHCSRNFRNPDVFDPSRWLGNPVYEEDRRGAMKPFSVGTRNCIGKHLAEAEIRTIISRLLWNFDIELCPESAHWTDHHAYWTWEKVPLWVVLRERGALTS